MNFTYENKIKNELSLNCKYKNLSNMILNSHHNLNNNNNNEISLHSNNLSKSNIKIKLKTDSLRLSKNKIASKARPKSTPNYSCYHLNYDNESCKKLNSNNENKLFKQLPQHILNNSFINNNQLYARSSFIKNEYINNQKYFNRNHCFNWELPKTILDGPLPNPKLECKYNTINSDFLNYKCDNLRQIKTNSLPIIKCDKDVTRKPNLLGSENGPYHMMDNGVSHKNGLSNKQCCPNDSYATTYIYHPNLSFDNNLHRIRNTDPCNVTNHGHCRYEVFHPYETQLIKNRSLSLCKRKSSKFQTHLKSYCSLIDDKYSLSSRYSSYSTCKSLTPNSFREKSPGPQDNLFRYQTLSGASTPNYSSKHPIRNSRRQSQNTGRLDSTKLRNSLRNSRSSNKFDVDDEQNELKKLKHSVITSQSMEVTTDKQANVPTITYGSKSDLTSLSVDNNKRDLNLPDHENYLTNDQTADLLIYHSEKSQHHQLEFEETQINSENLYDELSNVNLQYHIDGNDSQKYLLANENKEQIYSESRTIENTNLSSLKSNHIIPEIVNDIKNTEIINQAQADHTEVNYEVLTQQQQTMTLADCKPESQPPKSSSLIMNSPSSHVEINQDILFVSSKPGSPTSTTSMTYKTLSPKNSSVICNNMRCPIEIDTEICFSTDGYDIYNRVYINHPDRTITCLCDETKNPQINNDSEPNKNLPTGNFSSDYSHNDLSYKIDQNKDSSQPNNHMRSNSPGSVNSPNSSKVLTNIPFKTSVKSLPCASSPPPSPSLLKPQPISPPTPQQITSMQNSRPPLLAKPASPVPPSATSTPSVPFSSSLSPSPTKNSKLQIGTVLDGIGICLEKARPQRDPTITTAKIGSHNGRPERLVVGQPESICFGDKKEIGKNSAKYSFRTSNDIKSTQFTLFYPNVLELNEFVNDHFDENDIHENRNDDKFDNENKINHSRLVSVENNQPMQTNLINFIDVAKVSGDYGLPIQILKSLKSNISETEKYSSIPPKLSSSSSIEFPGYEYISQLNTNSNFTPSSTSVILPNNLDSFKQYRKVYDQNNNKWDLKLMGNKTDVFHKLNNKFYKNFMEYKKYSMKNTSFLSNNSIFVANNKQINNYFSNLEEKSNLFNYNIHNFEDIQQNIRVHNDYYNHLQQQQPFKQSGNCKNNQLYQNKKVEHLYDCEHKENNSKIYLINNDDLIKNQLIKSSQNSNEMMKNRTINQTIRNNNKINLLFDKQAIFVNGEQIPYKNEKSMLEKIFNYTRTNLEHTNAYDPYAYGIVTSSSSNAIPSTSRIGTAAAAPSRIGANISTGLPLPSSSLVEAPLIRPSTSASYYKDTIHIKDVPNNDGENLNHLISPRHVHYTPTKHGTVRDLLVTSNKVTPEAQEILQSLRNTILMIMDDLFTLDKQILNKNFRSCEAISEHLTLLPNMLITLLDHLHYTPIEYDFVTLASTLNSLIQEIISDPITVIFHLIELGFRLNELARLFGEDLIPYDLPRIVHSIQSKLHRVKIGYVSRQYFHVPQTSDHLITPYNKSRQILRLEEDCGCQINLIHPEDPRAIYCPHDYRTIEVVYDEDKGRHDLFIKRLNYAINPLRDTVRLVTTVVKQINGQEFSMKAEDANELLNCNVRPRYRDIKAIIMAGTKYFTRNR